ncbi:hypothetical protein GGI07_001785 [Coemansia sp. Benny D115]|nr:hypothetical protein GGI07_001785 [Coemansia sp. Benny D115]
MSDPNTTAIEQGLDASPLQYTPTESIPAIVQELRDSFASGSMKALATRKQHLRRMLDGLRASKRELLNAVLLDLGKSHSETDLYEYSSVEFEIGQMIDNMDKWARPDRNALTMVQPAFLLSHSEVRRDPLGAVVVLGAWNYPIRLALLPVVGALAAGNTVVLKPSELAPHTAVAIERMFDSCVDRSIARVVQGAVPETTLLLAQHFDHYFYTGGGTVGRIVARAAAEHLSGVTLELGGKSPAVVHADVEDLSVAAYRIMWAKLANAGQTCVTVDYLLVHRSVKDRLVDLLKDAAIGMFGPSPAASSDYGRIVNARNWRRLKKALDSTEGTVIDVTDDEPSEQDRFFPPTIVDGVRATDSLMADELFGPILPVVTFDTLDEALELINKRDQPLALYVFASKASARHVLENTRSGTACVNDTMFHLASQSNPFGGVGPSGVGRYTGKYSFDTFSHLRHVLERPSWFPSPAIDTVRGPPFSGPENQWKLALGRRMVYPRTWTLSESIWGRLGTLIPLWRLLAIVPGFLVALLRARPVMRQRKNGSGASK